MNFCKVFAAASAACALAYGQGTMTAIVNVDTANVIKAFDKRLVGANIEWFHNGNGIYDTSSAALRPSVIAAARDMGVGLLRFPGGGLADNYFWRDGIGPRSTRPARSNFLSGGVSANNFGTPELLTFAQRAGSDILMQTNVISSTAEEAAGWVSYCNSVLHPDRLRDGFESAYRVKYWEIGNEQYMSNDGSLAPNSALGITEYLQRFMAWTTAMKSVDSTIKVGAVSGKNFGRYDFVADPTWNATLLQRAAKQIDFIALHNAYGPLVFEGYSAAIDDVYRAMWGLPLLVEANLADIRRDIERYAPAEANRIELAITEWGPLFHVDPASPWIEHTKTMGSAIYVANLLQVLARTPQVTMATYFKLHEDNFMGAIQANGAFKPAYYAMQMFGANFGTKVIQASVASPAFKSPAIGIVSAVDSVPYLDVVASLNADGTKLYLIAVNKSTTNPIKATLNINGFNWDPMVTARILSAPAVDANNGPSLPQIPGILWAPQMTLATGSMFHSGSPGAVATRTSTALLELNNYSFAPLSVTALEFTRVQSSATLPPSAPSLPAPPTSTTGCTFSVNASAASALATGLCSGATISASASSCEWAASSDQSWTQVYPLSGKGSSAVQYTVFPNFSGRQRTARVTIGGRAIIITQEAASGTADERFVGQIYYNFFGRMASPAEVKFQVANGLPRGRADLVLSFLRTAEFNTGGRFIAGLYSGVLGRDCEYSGWLFQRDAVSKGLVDPLGLVANFLGSQEYKLRFGVQTDAQFVQSMYRSVLLREAQPKEITLQKNALTGGMTRAQFASALLTSAEFQERTGPRLAAFLLYATLLNREPALTELNAQAAEIASGTPMPVIVDRILRSPEFQTVL